MDTELMNAKGTRDIEPEKKILKDFVINRLIESFELHGFSPMETPIIEREDVLAAKYAGGTEILKEMFKLTDQGKRELALRYDLTVPLCRFVGMNQNIKLPFKRYMIGTVFRDGPVATDRLREFTQCDIDIIGSPSMLADAECLRIAQHFFETVGLRARIEVNNRKVLDGLMEAMLIPEDKRIDVILAIDKIKKQPIKEIEQELESHCIEKEKIGKLLQVLKSAKTNKEEIERLRAILNNDTGKRGLEEVEELLSYLDQSNIFFSISLARGLAYYTGTIFEIFLEEKEFHSSVASGGRYDKLIENFLGNPKNKTFPAIGISFGIDRICIVLQAEFNFSKRTVTEVFIIPINTIKESLDFATKLRAAGIKTDIDLMKRSISKNLEYASSMGIPYALIVGENELNAGKLTLREMDTGKEEKLPLMKIIKKLES